jgi:tetratricopeptide (TPR) repeat protein
VKSRNIVVICLPLALAGVVGCGKPPGGHLEAGMERLQRGDYDPAITLLEQAAVRQPGDASVYLNLGLAYWKMGYPEEAIQAAREAARLAPGKTEPLELLSEIFAGQRRWGDVREALAEANRISPESPRILTRMALAEANIGEPGLAKTYLLEALGMDANYGPALYNMAWLHVKVTGDRAAARDYFERYLACDPEDTKRAAVARSFLAPPPARPPAPAQEPAEPPTEETVEEPEPPNLPPSRQPVVESGPVKKSRSEDLVKQARLSIEKEEYVAALIKLREAVEEDPANPEALRELAVLYEKHLALPDKAAEAYARYRERFPEARAPRSGSAGGVPGETAASLALQVWADGLEQHKLGNWDAAANLYRQAINVDPACLNAVYNLGLVCKMQGKTEAARDAFEQALSIDPDMTKAMYMLGVVYRDLKQYSRAESVLGTLLRREPDYAKGHLLMGLVYRETGRADEARPHFERFIKLDPADSSAPKVREWLVQDDT